MTTRINNCAVCGEVPQCAAVRTDDSVMCLSAGQCGLSGIYFPIHQWNALQALIRAARETNRLHGRDCTDRTCRASRRFDKTFKVKGGGK